MYQNLMEQNAQDFNNQDYEILRKYIIKDYLSNKNSVQIDNNNLRLTELEYERKRQFPEINLSNFLHIIIDKYLFHGNFAQQYDLDLGQNVDADYLNQIENDKDLKEFQQQAFLDSSVEKNLISETFRNIKSRNQKILLIELALRCGENPMRMFGMDFAVIKKIFGISEIRVANESRDNLGSLNQSLEQEQIYNNETFSALDLSHHKKHILAIYLFVKYTGDNIFDLFTADEIAKLGGNKFISFCYEQKYCGQYNGKIPELEEQISYTKNIAISSISATLITFVMLLFVLNFVTFNPLLFILMPVVGVAVGGLTGIYVYKQKQELNESVETTDFDNFIQAYDNEIETIKNEEDRKWEEEHTERLDVDENELSNSYDSDENPDYNKPVIYHEGPLKKINEQDNDNDPDKGNTFHYYPGRK